MNFRLKRFQDSESDRERVPSGVEDRSQYELVHRVNAAISKVVKNGNGHVPEKPGPKAPVGAERVESVPVEAR